MDGDGFAGADIKGSGSDALRTFPEQVAQLEGRVEAAEPTESD